MCIVYIVFIMYFQQFIGNILSHILIQNTETIELVIDKIVKSRSLITSGQANIEINRIDSENGKHIDTKTKLKIWFDINHYRVDYIQEGDRMSFSDVGYEKVFCSNCEKRGTIFQRFADHFGRH